MKITAVMHFFEGQSQRWLLTFGIFSALILGGMDYVTGYSRSISVFYLFPIFIATWYVGANEGLLVTFVAILSSTVAGSLTDALPDKEVTLLWNACVRSVFFIFVIFILNAWKNERYRARFDFLTGIPNRYHFFEVLLSEKERCLRYHHPLSLVYLDIDNFKTVNDRYGHKAGDALLKQVARILKINFRSNDSLARLGGDEIIILMPETDLGAAEGKMKAVQDDLMNAMKSKNWPVSFSIGIAAFSKPSAPPEDLLKMADTLMYAAKQNGKNAIIGHMYA